MSMEDKIFLIVLEKGLLAFVLVVVGFLFNWVLQSVKLRREMVNELAVDRANAYKELWKTLASIRPGIDEEISLTKVDAIEKALVRWYHDEANALYMSWGTSRQYMIARRWLSKKPINSKKIRRRISRLRTQLKIDCGIYSEIQGILPLPSRKPQSAIGIGTPITERPSHRPPDIRVTYPAIPASLRLRRDRSAD